MAKKMTDDELLTICRQESYQAESYITSEVSQEREDAMERFLGSPYGDEVAGRSSVVTRDVLETIEWVMPSLLKVFVSSDDIVSYNPEGPEDEEFAKQATDLANVVFHKDNNGFLILNTWFKDALLQKQGVVKSYWDESESTTTTSYTGLNLMEFISKVSDDNVEVTEHSETNLDGSEYEGEADDDVTDEMYIKPETLHNVTVIKKAEKNRIKIMPIPPEEFYMSYDAADPDDATYLEHRAGKTKTQLINEGFDKKLIEGLAGDDTIDPTGERQTRMGTSTEMRDNAADKTMQEIDVHESYLWADTNGDGIAEWTRVLWVKDEILEQETVTKQPFSVITPVTVPHRAYGLSLADLVMDLSRIRTVIMRQTLDSLYLANNPEREVDVNLIVDMDDFLTTRPGGIKRVNQINASREIAHPFVAQHSFPMLDGLDGMMAKRTGVSDMAMGIDADVLSNVNSSVDMNARDARNQRVEMIARIFAETGVKHLFRRILNLLVENQDKPRTIKLRNQWVEMDTNGWNPEMDVTIDVGLGHGNRDQQVSHLNNILSWQKEILASGGLGMVTPKHVYNTMEKMLSAVGFKNADPFVSDPGDEPMQQPEQKDPQEALINAQMQIEQGKAKAAMAKAQMENETKLQQIRLTHHEKMQALELDTEKLDIEREKIAASMNETAAKIRSDEAKAAADLDAKAQIELARMNEKATDRQHNMMEGDKNRHVNMMKGQKSVNIQRQADGSLQGTMTDGDY